MKRDKATKTKMNPVFAVTLGIMILYTTIMFLLIGWGVMKSLQTVEDFVFQGLSYSAFPNEVGLDNYISSFSHIKYKDTYFGGMFLNSIVYAAGCAAVSVLMPCLIGYVTAKIDVWFNKILLGAVYFSMFFTCYGSMPSMIQVMNDLNLMNTWPGLFMMKASFLSNTCLIFNATFCGLSREYSEAATIDGASHLDVMLKVNFPLIKTTILVLFVTAFITFWNDYQTPMIYLSDSPTASYGLFVFNQSTNSYEDFLVYKVAGFVLILAPTFLIFLLMKDYLLGNLTEGGVKG
ncbi:MAG: carbohydrate ABC transporter permease [Clostridia bacterium]|nr:carbohydrate ABC transporter permease [Clostridia bacterium]